MISYTTFSFLPQEEQAKYLWKEGIPLELIRYTQNLMVELYSLDEFYVEIFFDKETEEPLFLKSFNDVKGLDPYLNDSSITTTSPFNFDRFHS